MFKNYRKILLQAFRRNSLYEPRANHSPIVSGLIFGSLVVTIGTLTSLVIFAVALSQWMLGDLWGVPFFLAFAMMVLFRKEKK